MLLPERFAVPDSGDLRADLIAWLAAVESVLDSPSGEGLFRSLIAAASENAEVAQRLRESLADPRLFALRLRAASDSGEVRADLPVDEVSEALIGAIMLRALARTPADPGLPERLVDLTLGPRPA